MPRWASIFSKLKNGFNGKSSFKKAQIKIKQKISKYILNDGTPSVFLKKSKDLFHAISSNKNTWTVVIFRNDKFQVIENVHLNAKMDNLSFS